MQTFHLLNGDCLAEQLKNTHINQGLIIFRECLIDGELNSDNLADFWETRAKFISTNYSIAKEEYYHKTVIEFNKLTRLPENSELYFWFENDLFCLINMCFILSIVSEFKHIKLYRVFPIEDNNGDLWKGFADSSSKKLEQAYKLSIPFSAKDINLGVMLWQAFKTKNYTQLQNLTLENSPCYKYLSEVCQAYIERFPVNVIWGRPERVIQQIIKDTSSTDFKTLFSEFSTRAGIYGFGDTQFKQLYQKVIGQL